MWAVPSSMGVEPGVHPHIPSHPHLDHPPRRWRPGAFTLLEILLVLALIGLIATVIAASVVRVIDADHPTPEDTFWQACQGAQRMASLTDRNVTLSFDAKDRKLVWSNGLTTDQAAFDPASGAISVQFLQAQQGGSVILIAGQVVETEEVPRVMFYPDGTCTAFRVQFRVGATAWHLDIDPWTCAPVLAKSDKTS
jgi:type II secretory pathway pseudopilin PulG